MLGAVDAVKSGMSRTVAAEQHGVPLSTLKDRFNGRVVHGANPGPRSCLSNDELADFLLECAKLAMGRQEGMSSALWSHTCRRANVS